MADESLSSLASNSGPITNSGILEMMVGLIFVVILIFGLAWLYKRLGTNALGLNNVIKVIAAMSLGNRDRIALIEVGEKQMLIGISPGRISTLHVFDEQVEFASNKEPSESDFANKLQSVLAGIKS